MLRASALAFAIVLMTVSAALAQTTVSASTTPPASERFHVDAEALVWWLKDSPAPVPLVSTGVLGQPGTQVLLGGRDVDTGAQPGVRLTVGYRLTDSLGLEASAFYLPTRTTSRRVESSGQSGSQALFIPFFDATFQRENTTNLASPGLFAGRATESLSTRLIGGELNGTVRLLRGAPFQLDLLGGFRYLNLRETYAFTTDSPDVPPRPPDVFRTRDEFEARNEFLGAQVGARARGDWRRWFASGAVKLALGAMRQSVDVEGALVTNDFNGFGAPQTFQGGYFAQPTNIGTHRRTVFAVVPEVGVDVGYRITDAVSVFVGYTFLYANRVARPGEQIDRTINPTQNASFGAPPPPRTLVGPARPGFSFAGSDFWAQGVNVGVSVRF